MGKGSRNRQRHVQEQLQSTGRKQQTKQTPKWLTPLISIVLVAAVLIGVVASVLTNSGIIYRNRILVESKTGNYDITQQTATFLAWQGAYYNAYYYWYYAYLGYITDKTVTTNYSSADSYAFDAARYTVQNSLRDGVQDLVESLVDYVAVCDAAEKAGVQLDEEELKEIDSTLDWLKDMQGSLGFATFNGFLKGAIGTGMKKSDIKHALEIVSLYNKYLSQKQEGFEKAVVLTDLEIFRDENPDDFFKTDYLSFKTEDKELSEKLAACTTAEEFRTAVIQHSFEKNYKTTFNNVATSKMGLDKLFPGSQINGGIVIAILIAIGVYILINKTTFGFQLKACGANRHAARYAGIKDKRNIVLSMALAGSLAGAAGSLYYLSGNTEFFWSTYQSLPAVGFNGIAVALLAMNNPIGVIFSGCFMSMLAISGMQLTYLTAFNEYITDVIIAVIVYLSAFSLIIQLWLAGRSKKASRRKQKTAAAAGADAPAPAADAGKEE